MKIPLDSNVQGNWAKPGKDIKNGDRLKLLDSGQLVEGKFGEQYIFKIMLKTREEYNLAFNRTSRNTLGKVWGTETEDWKGKVVVAFIVKQMIGDGLKNVMYLAPDGYVMTDDGDFVDPNEVEEPERPEITPDDIPF